MLAKKILFTSQEGKTLAKGVIVIIALDHFIGVITAKEKIEQTSWLEFNGGL